VLTLLVGLHLALAQEPCEAQLTAPPPALSVAWISPLRKRTSNARWLVVVPTRDLAAWLRAHPDATTGDLLRYVGERRRPKEPHRQYKVTIFDAEPGSLCRPLEGMEPPTAVEGVLACPRGVGRATRRYQGCGVATDYNTGGDGPEVYRSQWRDLARRGFCVIPAERFLIEGGR
jgi:hypothetical protein